MGCFSIVSQKKACEVLWSLRLYCGFSNCLMAAQQTAKLCFVLFSFPVTSLETKNLTPHIFYQNNTKHIDIIWVDSQIPCKTSSFTHGMSPTGGIETHLLYCTAFRGHAEKRETDFLCPYHWPTRGKHIFLEFCLQSFL